MLKHIILYEFKDIPKNILDEIFVCYELCRKKIKGFVSIKHGLNVSVKPELSHGFNYGIIMTFKTKEDLIDYNSNPQHLKAKEIMLPYLIKTLVYDIE